VSPSVVRARFSAPDTATITLFTPDPLTLSVALNCTVTGVFVQPPEESAGALVAAVTGADPSTKTVWPLPAVTGFREVQLNRGTRDKREPCSGVDDVVAAEAR
jgi:hypothetical protein